MEEKKFNKNSPEVNRIRLITDYDTSKTLKENEKIISEQMQELQTDDVVTPPDEQQDVEGSQYNVKNVFSYCTDDAENISKIKRGLSDAQIGNLSLKLYNAMNYWGTNDDAVFESFQSLLTMSDFCALNTYYNSQEYGKDESLYEWLVDDYSLEKDWDRIYAPLKIIFEKSYKQEGNEEGGIPQGTYAMCTDFDFTIGCVNEAIKNIQKCLGLTQDGAFGPITMKAIKSKLPDFDGSITEEVYKKILFVCRKEKEVDNGPLPGIEPKTSSEPITPTIPPSPPKNHGVNAAIKNEFAPEQAYAKVKQHLKSYRGGKKFKYPKRAPDIDTKTFNSLNKYFIKKGYKLVRGNDEKDKYVWIKK